MKEAENGTEYLARENEALKKRVAELEALQADLETAHKSHAELRSWLYALLDKLPAIVYLQAPDYTIPFANKYFIDRFGNPGSRHCYELLRDRDRHCENCPTLSVLETNEPLVWEWTETADGRVYMVYDYPFHDLDGSPLVLELGIDITDRKAVHEELKKSRMLQDAILDNIPDMAWLKDTKFRYIAVNGALAAAAGRPKDEVVGKTDFDIWPENLAERYRSDDADVLSSGERKSVEEPMVGAGGSEAWLHTIKTPIIGPDGRPMGTAGIARDITKRKRTEEELRKFKFILDGAGEEFYLLDRDGNILYANEAAARSLGYSRDELTGMKLMDIARAVTLDEWRERFGAFKEGDVPAFERIHTASDGREIPKEVKSVYLEISGREYVCAFARDITERKRIEKERTEFLAMVSHDVRSPMTTIIGMSELIADKEAERLDAESLEMIGDIMRGARKVMGMLEDFVTIARLETGKLPLRPGPVKPSEIVGECIIDFSPGAEQKSIELTEEVEEGLPTAIIDKHLVERALCNLAGNAVNYTPNGGHVHIGAKMREEDGEKVLELYVEDDGPGIPPEEHALAFEKYRRLKTASGVKGTGLGLPIVKAVAEAHGGRVELISEEGKGARFSIIIPYQKF